MAKIYVKTLVEKFNLEVLAGKENLSNEITMTGINRAGIELCGFFIYEKLVRLILLGSKEYDFVMKLTEKERTLRYTNIAKKNPPAILISKSFDDKILRKVCSEYKTPLIISNEMNSSEIIGTVGNFISEELIEYKTVHGTLLELFGEGVLIRGESGIGKSEIAMELIKSGHMFVGDDAIDVAKISGRLLGKPNPTVKNFIEIRGLGILNVVRMFGIERVKKSSDINVVIELKNISQNKIIDFERLGSKQEFVSIEGVKIPYYQFPVSPGRKISDLIESAVTDLKLRREGYNSAQEFSDNALRQNEGN